MAKFKTKLHLPKQINLLGDVWRIDIVKQPMNLDVKCLGTCDNKLKVITLKQGFQLDELTHELSHALLFTCFSQNDEFHAQIMAKFLEQIMRQVYFIK